ncbi:GGDEF domain-containing protein, partial [Enterobacter cloacae]
KELKIIASEDALTGLFNRRTFDEKILSEIATCADNDTPISILIVDVDYFKKYNDNYGHPEGDRCLTLLGNSLRESLTRNNQLVARYGGEEFALILPDADIQEAIRLAQTIIRNVFSLHIEHAFSPFGRVTVSVGVSTARAVDIAGSQQNIIIAADQALYQAKRAGRNRYAFIAV